MKTLSIISHKGGAGKTSSAVMLAEDFARRGFRVVLVDADRQKGAGLLLGIEQPTGSLQQTRDPKLRYFCSSGIPLRELPAKAEEMSGDFDIAVIDTPSLDDPLAKGWIQLSSHTLVVIPVEPLSIRTMEGADAALEVIKRLNAKIQVVGILPTMFDETDSVQRSLLMELQASRGDEMLPVTIPHDSGMVHRAEQTERRRTEASETTLTAYNVAVDHLVKSVGLKAAPAAKVPVVRPMAAPRTVPVAPAPVAATPQKSGAMGWILAAAAVLVLLVVALVFGVLRARADATPKATKSGAIRPAIVSPWRVV
jgi:chromosome partitioning protein